MTPPSHPKGSGFPPAISPFSSSLSGGAHFNFSSDSLRNSSTRQASTLPRQSRTSRKSASSPIAAPHINVDSLAEFATQLPITFYRQPGGGLLLPVRPGRGQGLVCACHAIAKLYTLLRAGSLELHILQHTAITMDRRPKIESIESVQTHVKDR